MRVSWGRTFVLAAVCCAAGTMLGCFSTSHGRKMDSAQVSSIQRGATTRAQIEQMFGPPTSVSLMGDGRRMMMYMSMQSDVDHSAVWIPGAALVKGVGSKNRNQQLQVVLNRDDVVEDYEFADTTTNTKHSGVIGGMKGESTTVSHTPAR